MNFSLSHITRAGNDRIQDVHDRCVNIHGKDYVEYRFNGQALSAFDLALQMNLKDEFQEVELCELLTNDRGGDIEEPQPSTKEMRHVSKLAAIETGVPLPIIAVVPKHTEIYTTAIGIKAREQLTTM